jgi:hypothetical protein
MSYPAASFIFAWGGCGTIILDLLLALLVGMAVGKIAVRRWLGFWAGVFVGIGTPLSYILAAFIPSYPGHISSSTVIVFSGAWWWGVVADIILAAFCAAIGGLVSFFGARITTRTHPYYR